MGCKDLDSVRGEHEQERWQSEGLHALSRDHANTSVKCCGAGDVGVRLSLGVVVGMKLEHGRAIVSCSCLDGRAIVSCSCLDGDRGQGLAFSC